MAATSIVRNKLVHLLAALLPVAITYSLSRTGGDKTDVPWEVVYVAANDMEAAIVQGRLESEGIPSVARGEAVGKVFGMTVGPLAQVEILVPTSLSERAHALLDGLEETKEEETPEDTANTP